MSMTPTAEPREYACTIGIPFTRVATPECVCPLTIASIFSVTALARSTISPLQPSRLLRSQKAPAWAMTTTTSAPRARSARACSSTTRAGLAKRSPTTLLALVVVGVSTVATPITPTLTPCTSTSVSLRIHGTSRPALSVTFAPRIAYGAWRMRALSESTPQSNSWLPNADATSPCLANRETTLAP